MQIFKLFFTLLSKNIGTIIMWLMIGISIIAITTATSGSTGEATFTGTKTTVGIIDRDNTPASQEFISCIEARHSVVFLEDDKAGIKDLLYYDMISYCIEIEKGFEENFGKGEALYKGSYINYTQHNVLAKNDIDEILRIASVYNTSGLTPTESLKKSKEAVAENVEVNIAVKTDEEVKGLTVPQFIFYRGIPYSLCNIIIITIPLVLTVLNKKEIRDRINASMVSSKSRIGQLFLAGAIYVAVMWVIISVLVFITATPDIYCLISSLMFCLSMVGLALFLSALDISINMINWLSNIISLSMAFFCGCFVDTSILDESVQTIAQLLPMNHYTKTVYMCYNNTFNMQDFIINNLILLCFAVFFIVLAGAVTAVKQRGGIKVKNT